MPAFVVTYFYPDGSYAGIVGARYYRESAEELIAAYRLSYGDCTFIVTEIEIE